MEVIPFGKSFIYISNDWGPNTERCEIPATMLFCKDVWSFRTIQ